MSAVHARRRSHVDQMVGGPDRILIMFHNKNGVAQIAQTPQRDQQPFIVTLMQPDGRFVQYVQHAGEAGADLAGEADALRLPPRQRRRPACQCQIIQSDIDQEPQTVDDFSQDAAGNFLPLRRQLRQHLGEPAQGRPDRLFRCVGDVFAGNADRQRLGLQPSAVAYHAGLFRLIAGHLLPHPGAVGFLPAALQVLQHAFERFRDGIAADAVFVGEGDGFVGAMQDRVSHVGRQILPGGLCRLLVVPRQALQGLVVVRRLRPGPRHDRPIRQPRSVVRHDQIGIEKAFHP